MIKGYYTKLIALFVYSILISFSSSAQTTICYAIADEGNPDVLFQFQNDQWSPIGNTGAFDIEAIAFNPDLNLIYAANGGDIGLINSTNGSFSLLNSLTTINGSPYGSLIPDDIDGLTFDAANNVLWAIQRIPGTGNNDILLQIDPQSGSIISNAFGSGVDYVTVEEVFDGTLGANVYDVDDVAIDPTTGILYAISNQGGVGGVLVAINPADGSLEQVIGDFSVDDMEGLTFSGDGLFYGTSGNNGPVPDDNNNFYSINVFTGEATFISDVDPTNFSFDFEAVECFLMDAVEPPCEATSPTIVANDDEICLGDGEFVVVGLVEAGSGSVLSFVVTDETGTIIESGPSASNIFNFDGSQPGECLIWGINHDGSLNAPTNQVADLEGCFALSNSVSVEKIDCTVNPPCEVTAPIISSDINQICIGQGDIVNISVDFSEPNDQIVFVVTDETATNILAGPTSSTEFNFDAAPEGTCLIWAVAHDGSLVAPSDLVADMEGCFELSNAISVLREDCPPGCDLTMPVISSDNPVICIGDGELVNITLETIDPNDQVVFVVTDVLGTTILAGPQTSNIFNFDNAPEGTCLIWAIAHDGTLVAPTDQVADLEGCYALSNAVSVIREDCTDPCDVTAPVISSDNPSICIGDGELVTVSLDAFDTNDIITYVVTDNTGTNILDGPTSNNIFNFDAAPEGICLIWAVAHDGSLVAPSDLVADLEGCFALSNAVSIIREDCTDPCNVTAPVISSDNPTICIGEGELVTVSLDAFDVTDQIVFVVTDINGTTILAGPQTNNVFNFDAAPAGTCLIWAVAHDGTLVAPTDQVADLEGCFELSNAVAVIREDCTDPCDVTVPVISTNDPSICIGDGELVTVSLDAFDANDQIIYVVTDITGTTILSGPTTNNVFNFDGAPAGTCLIWAVAHDGTLVAPTNQVADLEGCFALSNPVEILREDCDDENDPPVIGEDINEICTQPVTPTTICIDPIDPNGDNVVITEVETLFNCSIDQFNDTCFIYTPLPGLTGTDSLTIIGCDDGVPPLCDTIVYYVSIGCQEPIAAPDDIYYIWGQGATVNGAPVDINNDAIFVDVLANDSDPCNSSLNVSTVTQPANGTVMIVNGTPQYEPDAGYTGTDIFTYEVCNSCGACTETTVNILIEEVVGPCMNDTIVLCTEPITPVEICVDDFCELDDVTEAIIGASTTFNCSIEILSTNCLEYTPLPGFTGVDTVEIIGMDGSGNMDTVYALVELDCDVTSVEAETDMATTDQDVPVIIDVLDNDVDNSPCTDPLTVTQIVSDPENGVATINLDGTITYTPNAGFAGMDFFMYEVCNCLGDCDIANVVVTVDSVIIVNPDVVAVNDTDTTAANTPVTIEVLDNDTGDNISVVDVCDPANGTAVIFGNTVVYVPEPGFGGWDTFCYVICDDQTPAACDTADIFVFTELMDPNECPVLTDDLGNPVSETLNFATETDSTSTIICLSAIDPDGDDVTIEISQNGSLGTAVINQYGCLIYSSDTISGIDTVIVTACDDATDQCCDELTVIIGVSEPGINMPPIVIDDNGDPTDTLYVEACEDVALIDCINVIDPEMDTISMTISVNGTNGTAVVDTLTCLTYTPNENYNGGDTLTIFVCDDFGNCVLTTYIIDVLPKNDNPVANDDQSQTDEDTPVVIDVLLNDFDIDGDSLIIKDLIEEPNNGTVVFNNDGTVTYTPDPGFAGADTFVYAISDLNDGCDTATVVILVGEELIIDAVDNDTITPFETPVVIEILTNDIFNGEAEVIDFTQPVNGTVVLANDVFTYTPNDDFTGTDCWDYVIMDEFGLLDTATVCVEVEGPGETGECNDLLNNTASGLTPNGDGTNDTWAIPEISSCCSDGELLIFNRWGNIVHRDQNFADGVNWNGTWDTEDGNGELVPSGTYFWCILCDGDLINGPGKYDGFIEVINGAQ